MLDILQKQVRIGEIEAGCRRAAAAGLKVRGLFMMATPGERPDTPELNRDFMMRVPLHAVAFSTFVPFPGTPIWENPEKYFCSVVNLNFDRYNIALFHRQNGKIMKRRYVPFIRNRLLTVNQQADNVARMEQYAEDSGKLNSG